MNTLEISYEQTELEQTIQHIDAPASVALRNANKQIQHPLVKTEVMSPNFQYSPSPQYMQE